jgi:Zn-dependent alcohol dehydrogenase
MPYGANENTKYLNFTNFIYKNKTYSSLIYTLAKKCKIHSQFVSKIPNNISLRDASIIGCAVISGYVPIINNQFINKNSSLAIFGMGGLGLLTLNAAKKIGVKDIVSIDIDAKKLKFAKKFGAKNILNIKDKNFDKKLKSFSHNKGFDFIFDCVGKKNIQEGSIKHLKKCIPGFKRGGTLGIVGFHYDQLEFSAKDLLMNENTIYGIRGGSTIMKKDLPQVYKDIYSKKLHLHKLVTNTFNFKDINKAIMKLESGKIIGRAVIKI